MRRIVTLALTMCFGVGCVASRFIGGTASALVSSPRKVEHKIEHPVRSDARLAVLWVGHATFLIQIDDRMILTDPVFTPTVGMLAKRIVEPGLDPAALPPLDVVLISHLHFDHLSLGSLETIEPKVRTVLLPPGGTTYLTDFGFPAVELHTWQVWEKDGLRVTAAPIDHLGFRYGADRAWMQHSFTGYVIEYHGIRVYFGGDTAYDGTLFTEAARRFPGLDLAILPIAPLEPREFMRPLHMNPTDAMRAFFDLGAKRMIPMHYDTFANPEDPPGAALPMLEEARKTMGIAKERVLPLAIGEQRVLIAK
jgi:L-ascorbate metabolism protein UlaG (beta-lactamase superfamily)